MKLRHAFRPRDAVVTSLAGGLGNQMFQYAAGWALARRHGCRLVLDSRSLHARGLQTLRPYALDAYRIEATLDSLGRFALGSCRTVAEAGGRYQPGLMDGAGPGSRLQGYWQCERYFVHERTQLLQHFSLRQGAGAYATEVAQAIRARPDAICLHFRRGDYVSNPEAARHHGSCTMDYYESALALLRSQSPGGALFIFSDDTAWVREQVSLARDACVVDSGRSSPAEDIWLMSLCTHHVVANSSFSWWGAWLATGGGRTCAPRRWFADPGMDDADLVPAAWTRL